MEMVEVNTCELVGPALDWAVAKATDTKIDHSRGKELRIDVGIGFQSPWMPSVNWYQGGPLIEKNRIELRPSVTENWLAEKIMIRIETSANYWRGFGSTILIAACRAIAQGNLGDTVSVPKELMQ